MSCFSDINICTFMSVSCIKIQCMCLHFGFHYCYNRGNDIAALKILRFWLNLKYFRFRCLLIWFAAPSPGDSWCLLAIIINWLNPYSTVLPHNFIMRLRIFLGVQTNPKILPSKNLLRKKLRPWTVLKPLASRTSYYLSINKTAFGKKFPVMSSVSYEKNTSISRMILQPERKSTLIYRFLKGERPWRLKERQVAVRHRTFLWITSQEKSGTYTSVLRFRHTWLSSQSTPLLFSRISICSTRLHHLMFSRFVWWVWRSSWRLKKHISVYKQFLISSENLPLRVRIAPKRLVCLNSNTKTHYY